VHEAAKDRIYDLRPRELLFLTTTPQM
jgi:hypothetical protein